MNTSTFSLLHIFLSVHPQQESDVLFTFIRDYFLAFLCVVNAWECALRCTHVRHVEATENTGRLSPLFYALLPWHGASHWTRSFLLQLSMLAGQWAPGPRRSLMLGYRHVQLSQAFYTVTRDFNSSPHAYRASALTHWATSQTIWGYLNNHSL